MPSGSLPTIMASFLGTQPYERVHALQRALAGALQRGIGSELVLCLDHPPVITLGTRAKPQHVTASSDWLRNRGISLCRTERGGDVTYHGPGQLIVYPIFRIGRAVRAHVTALARATAQTLSSLGIEATWDDRRPGLWVGHEKIAAVGLAVQGGVAFHGLALNASVDLSGFSAIVPCGLTEAGVTSIEKILGSCPPLPHLARDIVSRLASIAEKPAPTFFPPKQLFAYLSQWNDPSVTAISQDFSIDPAPTPGSILA